MEIRKLRTRDTTRNRRMRALRCWDINTWLLYLAEMNVLHLLVVHAEGQHASQNCWSHDRSWPVKQGGAASEELMAD